MYDVVTMGETMVRLTPPNLHRIEQATMFQIHIGGSESNTAVGMSRLGAKACWISRLPDNSVGHLIVNRIREHGVDVSHVVWSDHDRAGTYFMEESRPPRPVRITYDRANSAMSKIQPADLPRDLFVRDNARLLHLTGITVALSDTAAATMRQALSYAKEAGWLVSFDLNYRALLWSPEAAHAGCEPFMQVADIIFLPLRDAQTIYGYDEGLSVQAILHQLHERYPQALIVMTLGAEGSAAFTGTGEIIQQPVIPAEVIYRVGGGDAFTAGFLYNYLAEGDPASALHWGSVTAALKYSIEGDMAIVNRGDVLDLLQSSSGQLRVLR